MLRPRTTAARAILHAAPRGAAIIEFALVMPFLALLVVGLCDLGFAVYKLDRGSGCGRSRRAIRRPQWLEPTAITTAVTSATGASGISATPAPSEVYGCPDGGTLTIVASTVSAVRVGARPASTPRSAPSCSMQTVLPYPGLPSPLTLTGQAYRRIK